MKYPVILVYHVTVNGKCLLITVSLSQLRHVEKIISSWQVKVNIKQILLNIFTLYKHQINSTNRLSLHSKIRHESTSDIVGLWGGHPLDIPWTSIWQKRAFSVCIESVGLKMDIIVSYNTFYHVNFFM